MILKRKLVLVTFFRTTLIVALCVSIPLALALIASVIVRFYRNHRGAMNKISVQMSNIDDPDDEVRKSDCETMEFNTF